MTRRKCEMPDCTAQIPIGMLMCRDHWWPVPSDVQREVNATWKAWRRNPAHFDAFQAHDNAVKAAVAAVLASRARIAQARQEAFNES